MNYRTNGLHLFWDTVYNEQEKLGTADAVRTISWVTFSYRLLHEYVPVLAVQQGLTYTNSVQTLDAV